MSSHSCVRSAWALGVGSCPLAIVSPPSAVRRNDPQGARLLTISTRHLMSRFATHIATDRHRPVWDVFPRVGWPACSHKYAPCCRRYGGGRSQPPGDRAAGRFFGEYTGATHYHPGSAGLSYIPPAGASIAEAYTYQDVPFDMLVEVLGSQTCTRSSR